MNVREEVDFDLHERIRRLQKAITAGPGDPKIELSLSRDVPQVVKGNPTCLDQYLNQLISKAMKLQGEGSMRITVSHKKREGQKIWIHFDISHLAPVASNGKKTTRALTGSFELSFKPCQPAVRAHRSFFSNKEIEQSLDNYRILLVEDTVMNQKVGMRMLRKWGAAAKLAENGIEAVEMCRREYFDLILMDLQMPLMSGFEATRKIRWELPPPISKIPIIALTASVREGVKKQVLESGMNASIAKPIVPAKLHALILFYLEKGTGNSRKRAMAQ